MEQKRRWMAVCTWVALAGLSMAAPEEAPAQSRGSVTCSSSDGRFKRCRTPWEVSELDRQLSNTRCVRGQTWGSERGSVWVDRGCRASFIETRFGGGFSGGNSGGFSGGNGGGFGGGNGGGFSGGNNHGFDHGWQESGGSREPFTVKCESSDGHYRLCRAGMGKGARVQVARRTSNSPCEQGRSWGYDRSGVWVDHGCRAYFTVFPGW